MRNRAGEWRLPRDGLNFADIAYMNASLQMQFAVLCMMELGATNEEIEEDFAHSLAECRKEDDEAVALGY